jgi:hypothetical protein
MSAMCITCQGPFGPLLRGAGINALGRVTPAWVARTPRKVTTPARRR